MNVHYECSLKFSEKLLMKILRHLLSLEVSLSFSSWLFLPFYLFFSTSHYISVISKTISAGVLFHISVKPQWRQNFCWFTRRYLVCLLSPCSCLHHRPPPPPSSFSVCLLWLLLFDQLWISWEFGQAASFGAVYDLSLSLFFTRRLFCCFLCSQVDIFRTLSGHL